MILPDLNIAKDSDSSSVVVGFDASAKYYVISKDEKCIRNGDLYSCSYKALIFTVEQAREVHRDLGSLLYDYETHKKYK